MKYLIQRLCPENPFHRVVNNGGPAERSRLGVDPDVLARHTGYSSLRAHLLQGSTASRPLSDVQIQIAEGF